MRSRSRSTADPVAPAVQAALAAPGRGLDRADRAPLESRLGGDLGRLSVHRGPAVDRAAATLGARGFAVGRHVAVASRGGPETLAHEAAHALQQDMAEPRGTVPVLPATAAPEREARAAAAGTAGPVRGGHAPFLGRDMTDPGRLEQVHQNVRVAGPPRTTPAGTQASRLPWVDGPVSDPNSTAHLIFNQTWSFLDARYFAPRTGTSTTAANLDADAVAMHQRVVDHYPQISSPLSDAEVQARVGLVNAASVSGDPDFLNAWMDNFIEQMSDSEDYQIDTSNTNYRDMITQLINDPDVGPKIVTLASGTSGFTSGEGLSRRIFVHPSVSAQRRQTTLIHEIVHLYRHTLYKAWVAASLDEGHYNEGLTEWLAQRVMTPAEQATRTGHQGYEDRVRTVQDQIADHVSEHGIAQAFFAGEVWRLETQSAEARTAFEGQTGIAAGGTRAEEIAGSRSSGGFFETVAAGSHFRFINLGVDEAQPKPEHREAFRTVKQERLDPEPTRGVRFVGHASGPGSDAHNRALSRRRSVAFYRMARAEGLPWTRLVDADHPPHFGAAQPSVTETGQQEDVIARAMNRRVEMFLIDGGAP